MARSDVRHNLTFEGTGTERGSVNHRESESVTAGLEGRLQSRSPPLPRGLPPHSWPLRPRSVPPPAKPFSPGASALWQSIFWSFTVTLLKPSFNSLPYGYYTKKKKKTPPPPHIHSWGCLVYWRPSWHAVQVHAVGPYLLTEEHDRMRELCSAIMTFG